MSRKYTYTYYFQRFGRSYHLRLRSLSDLEQALRLDPALWVATSMPLQSVCGDPAFLGFMDADANGRITHREVCLAITWLRDVLSDDGPCDEADGTVSADSLNLGSSDGRAIAATLEKVVAAKRLPSRELHPDVISSAQKELRNNPLSETGVILPAAAADDESRNIIRLAIRIGGEVPHPSGIPGLNRESYDRFRKALGDYLSIRTSLRSLSGNAPCIESYPAHEAIIKKIDEYFRLCDTHAYFGALNGRPVAVTGSDDEIVPDRIAALPLASIRNDSILDFRSPVNPMFAEAFALYRSAYVSETGSDAASISGSEWKSISAKYLQAGALYDRLASLGSAASILDEYGADRLSALEAAGIFRDVESLLEAAGKTAFTLTGLERVEKLSLFQRYLLNLANNFIGFSELYDPAKRACFEMGSLVIDNRILSLAVFVENRAKHIAMARNSSMYILYVRVTKSAASIAAGNPIGGSAAAYEVAIPVTGGGKGNLAVGKHGVFIDRNGYEHDAEIVEIIENPIALGEAVTAPVRRIMKTITGKLEALTGEADQKLQTYVGSAVDEIGRVDISKAAGSAEAVTAANTRNIGTALLGGSVAIAAVGSAVAYIVNTLTSMQWWQILAGLGGVLVAVIFPAVLLAVLKLRRRDLSAIIEASGWAINARMKLTRQLRRTFTTMPDYPRNSRGIPLHRRRRIVEESSKR